MCFNDDSFYKSIENQRLFVIGCSKVMAIPCVGPLFLAEATAELGFSLGPQVARYKLSSFVLFLFCDLFSFIFLVFLLQNQDISYQGAHQPI